MRVLKMRIGSSMSIYGGGGSGRIGMRGIRRIKVVRINICCIYLFIMKRRKWNY